MARAYSLDLRERVVAAVASGQSCRAAAVWGERRERGEMVAALPGHWQRGRQAVGRPTTLCS